VKRPLQRCDPSASGRPTHRADVDQPQVALPDRGLYSKDVHRVSAADTVRSRLTGRLRTAIGESVANAAFTTAAQIALPAVTPPVEHLGIDDTRRGKAKFQLVATPLTNGSAPAAPPPAAPVDTSRPRPADDTTSLADRRPSGLVSQRRHPDCHPCPYG
jgi:hypothetical protein